MALAATPAGACSDDATQEFVDAADDLCSKADEEIAEIELGRGKKRLDDYVAAAERVADDLVSDLREQEPPEAHADRVDEFVERLERAAALLEPAVRAAIRDDTAALDDLQQEAEQVTDEIAGIAKSFGFETCGAKVLGAR
ncbi:MAG: hypothetical protein M3271_12435 [Actinomycetota bacterium]|nr:hypothetical protein [Actinomycetota bacterium]